MLLFAAASFQQIGLVRTTAGKAGFITGLYVVIVPLLLALAWGERVGWSGWLGAGLAALGLFLLSVQAASFGWHPETVGCWSARSCGRRTSLPWGE